ncbi:MAG: biopolymer transporter ExbB [Rhodobacterales bacterium]|nr:MAG: biopolymer transporter ExbB [Rhodobacterales bacterium]
MEQPVGGPVEGLGNVSKAVAQPYFAQPVRQILLIAIALGLVAAGIWMVLPAILPVIRANLYLNGAILFVFAIGLYAALWQVAQIVNSVRWIARFARGEDISETRAAPRLLASLAELMRERGVSMQIGASSSRSILDSVAMRIDEQREITRYITNTLIFLGLLGTFYGLATTVPAVVDTIRSLAPSEGEEGVAVFNRLMTGLEAQLSGMGTAFSSSLLGLAGSLIVGLVELFATHAQNRFYRELEEWLSSITRLGFATGEDGQVDPRGAAAYLAHMAEQMESLTQMFTQSDVSRAMVDERLGTLADAVDRLARQIHEEGVSTPHIIRMAEGQERLIEAVQGRGVDGSNAETQARLRSMDVHLLRILEEVSASRQEGMSELKDELARLNHLLRHGAGEA